MKKILLIGLVVLVLGLVGCAESNSENNSENTIGTENSSGSEAYNDLNNNASDYRLNNSANDYNEYNYNENLGIPYHISFPDDGIIEVTDSNFAEQMLYLKMNSDDFLGRTIRYEGEFLSSYWGDEVLYFVARFEGGCCGVYGFEVYLNEIYAISYGTWVEVTGVLEQFYDDMAGEYFVRLNVITILERE